MIVSRINLLNIHLSLKLNCIDPPTFILTFFFGDRSGAVYNGGNKIGKRVALMSDNFRKHLKLAQRCVSEMSGRLQRGRYASMRFLTAAPGSPYLSCTSY